MAKLAKIDAFRAFDQGKRPSDLKRMGLLNKTLYKYYSLWKKGEAAGSRSANGALDTTGTHIRGKAKPMEVEIDNRLYLLYNWDITTTGWKGSFDQWIFDCVMGWHIDHKDELQLEKLFAEVK